MFTIFLQLLFARVWTLEVPRAPQDCFARTGHLNLGMLVSLHQPGTSDDSPCGPLVSASKIQDVAAMLYAIDELNKRDDILPNITLGAVVLDECSSVMTALASSVHLLPTSVNVQHQFGHTTNCSDGPPDVNIVGAIGPTYSSQAVHVGSLLSVFQIPLMGLVTTSDELSDKSRLVYANCVLSHCVTVL